MNRDPATLVINALGGLTKTAKEVGKDTSSVFRWKMPKEKGGADGRVPAGNFFSVWRALLMQGSSLSLEEVVFTEEEREQISAIQDQYQPVSPDASSPQNSEKVGAVS